MSLTLSQGMELFKEALFTLISSNENEGNAEIFLTDLLVDQDEDIVKQVNTLLGMMARKNKWKHALLSAKIEILKAKSKLRKIIFHYNYYISWVGLSGNP